ncbi:MAG: redoxin domain-containing protein [Aureliella sp.]
MKLILTLVCILLLCPRLALSQDKSVQDRTIEGRVVDADGRPVANATVARFWWANGNKKKPDGTPLDLTDKSQLKEFWGHLGQMEPAADPTMTKDDGTFEISLGWRDRALFAMNADRTQGCIVEVPVDTELGTLLILPLTRLCTVRGEFRSSVESKSVAWSHAYVDLPLNAKNPLASDRLISCGSFDRRFEVRLPSGSYELEAYGCSDLEKDNNDLCVDPAPQFTVRDTDIELDIGILNLTLAPPTPRDLEEEAKREGQFRDYTQHYGEPAPQWHSVDGRGIDHIKNVESLRGKWVLLDFWGTSCAPCLGHGIPKMMEFYEKNAKSKSRFEVVGICIEATGEIDDMAKLDKALSAIVTNVWKGKKIPFPIVLDNTMKTWERYGIPGLGTVVLINPDGQIVEGDESTLQAILDKEEP